MSLPSDGFTQTQLDQLTQLFQQVIQAFLQGQATLTGPQGPQGTPGLQGLQGTQWEQGPQGDQGVPSTTPPGSPRLLPQELGFISFVPSTTPPGSPKISPVELGSISPRGIPDNADLEAIPPLETWEEPSWICSSGVTRCQAFSEPPASSAPFTFTQRCALPQQQSISQPDAKPCGSQRAEVTRGPPCAPALQHHLGSSSGLGYTWFNAYWLTWLNTCGLNLMGLIESMLVGSHGTLGSGIESGH